MTVSLFTFVDLYRRQLDAASHLLSKGAAFAGERGISEAEMLGWRLADDMHPLAFQLMVVTNFSLWWPARVAGVPELGEVPDTLDVSGFQAAIADARAKLATFTADQFAGRDELPYTHDLRDTKVTLPSGQWLSVFATTNLYFHLSMIYAILRMKGVPLGKLDLFAAGL